MKYLKHFGAAGTVTGSCHLIVGDNDRGTLVDMGMFQGRKEVWDMNHVYPKFNAHEIDNVLLTHAHLDHCGRLPLLSRLGFTGNIYATRATIELAEIVMFDAAKIAQMDEEKDPLYTDDHVVQVLEKMKEVNYDSPFQLGSYEIVYKDAGHLLGSAIIEIVDKTTASQMKKIIFSGDLGNTPDILLRPTEMSTDAQVVVMESTYGDRNHPDQDNFAILADEINTVRKENSVLMIPAFSLERTQLILYMIKRLKRENKIQNEISVFLDSPMGIEATAIYEEHEELFNEKIAEEFEKGDPFDFPGLNITRSPKQSKRIGARGGSKVIVAGSGMMSGGRILGHAKKYLSDTKNRLLQVGYQGEETLGREIKFGAKEVTIDEEVIPVNAHITSIDNLSAHADQTKLMNWLKNINGVKKVVLIHGEDGGPRQTLAEKINIEMGITDINLPQLNDVIDLV